MEQTQNQTLTMTLTVDQINTILVSLSKQPYEAVAGLIGVIQSQAQAEFQRLNELANAPAKAAVDTGQDPAPSA